MSVLTRRPEGKKDKTYLKGRKSLSKGIHPFTLSKQNTKQGERERKEGEEKEEEKDKKPCFTFHGNEQVSKRMGSPHLSQGQ